MVDDDNGLDAECLDLNSEYWEDQSKRDTTGTVNGTGYQEPSNASHDGIEHSTLEDDDDEILLLEPYDPNRFSCIIYESGGYQHHVTGQLAHRSQTVPELEKDSDRTPKNSLSYLATSRLFKNTSLL